MGIIPITSHSYELRKKKGYINLSFVEALKFQAGVVVDLVNLVDMITNFSFLGDLHHNTNIDVHIKNLTVVIGFLCLILEFIRAGVICSTNSKSEFWKANKIFMILFIFLSDLPVIIFA